MFPDLDEDVRRQKQTALKSYYDARGDPDKVKCQLDFSVDTSSGDTPFACFEIGGREAGRTRATLR